MSLHLVREWTPEEEMRLSQRIDDALLARIKRLKRPWVVRDIAQRLLEEFERDSDMAALFDEWVASQRRQLLSQRIRWLEKNKLRATRRAALVDTLEAAGAELIAAPPMALRPFEATMSVKGERKRVGDMTGGDHRIVATGYAQTGHTALMLEAFHLAVAKRVRDERTADVLSEEQYMAMYRSIIAPSVLMEETA